MCGFEPAPVGLASFLEPPRYPSEACVDRVLQDFGTDTEAILGAEGRADPYDLVYGELEAPGTVESLLWAAHALLAGDLGVVTSRSELAQAVEPGRPAAAALYDYVTDEIHRTSIGFRSDAHAGVLGHDLFLYDLPPGIDGAAVLAHEARHAESPAYDHVDCGGEEQCDRARGGPISLQIGVHELARDHAADEITADLQQSWIDALRPRVLD